MGWSLIRAKAGVATNADEFHLYGVLFCHRESRPSPNYMQVVMHTRWPQLQYTALPFDQDYVLYGQPIDPTDSVNFVLDHTGENSHVIVLRLLEKLKSGSMNLPTFGFGRHGGYESFGVSRSHSGDRAS